MSNFLKGWRTLLFGLAVAIAPAALTYLSSIDWTQYVSPNVALFIVGGIGVALRAITTTAIGKKS